MSRRIVVLSRASEDIEEYWFYLWMNAGEGVADRFNVRLDHTLQSLRFMPNRGSRRPFGVELLRELRSVPVAGFSNMLVFYRVTPRAIEVVRVIHAMRDLDTERFD